METNATMAHPNLLSTAEEIQSLASLLQNEEMIAVDTEFIREVTFYPMVEIIQVATQDQSWLVDARSFKKRSKSSQRSATGLSDFDAYDSALTPLLEVFQNPKILKIVHAAQGDQECLYTNFKVVVSPVLDTAVAASLCGYGESIGLAKLLKSALNVNVAKGHARTNWSVRPLPQHLVEYAHSDVIHLVRLAKKLLNQLDGMQRRDWALELSARSADPALYEMDVEGITRKLSRGGKLDEKGFVTLFQLVQWREHRVRELNVPRRWVAEDPVLVDLARVRPVDLNHLGAFRGLNKGELKNSGEAILKAIQKGSEPSELPFPLPEAVRPIIPSFEESQVLELLRCYINILADRHRVAAKHLLTSAKLLALLRTPTNTPSDLANAGILSAEAASLIGEELIALIRGKRALTIRNHQIEIMTLEP